MQGCNPSGPAATPEETLVLEVELITERPGFHVDCVRCGTVFLARRRTRKFCTAGCRIAAHRAERRASLRVAQCEKIPSLPLPV